MPMKKKVAAHVSQILAVASHQAAIRAETAQGAQNNSTDEIIVKPSN